MVPELGRRGEGIGVQSKHQADDAADAPCQDPECLPLVHELPNAHPSFQFLNFAKELLSKTPICRALPAEIHGSERSKK
jgi:hypothetical protein